MFAILVFSPKCPHCNEVYGILKQTPYLDKIQLHNIHEKPVPDEHKQMLTHVPAVITKDGALLLGTEVKRWATELIPCEVESFCNSKFASFDGNPNLVPNLYNLDLYGSPLAPPLTPEIEAKISKKLQNN